MPKTQLGKWSIIIAAIIIFCFVAFYLLGEVLDLLSPGMESIFLVAARIALVASVVAFVMALFAVFNKKERSLLISLPIIVGLLVFSFIIGNIVHTP